MDNLNIGELGLQQQVVGLNLAFRLQNAQSLAPEARRIQRRESALQKMMKVKRKKSQCNIKGSSIKEERENEK